MSHILVSSAWSSRLNRTEIYMLRSSQGVVVEEFGEKIGKSQQNGSFKESSDYL